MAERYLSPNRKPTNGQPRIASRTACGMLRLRAQPAISLFFFIAIESYIVWCYRLGFFDETLCAKRSGLLKSVCVRAFG